MRVIIWLIALYVLADFSDPALSGAFNFDPDASVEVVRAQRVSASTAASGEGDRVDKVLRGPVRPLTVCVVALDGASRRIPGVVHRKTPGHEPRRTLHQRQASHAASEEAAPTSLAA
jgi:hypothetical protein